MFVFRKIPRFLILHDFSLGLEHQKQVVTGNNTSTGATYVHVRSTVYPQIGWNVAVCSKWAVFCVFFRINIWNIIMFQKTAFGLLPTDVHLRPIKQRHVWHIFIRLLQSFTCKNVLSTTKNFKYSSVSFKMRFLKRNKGCQGKAGEKDLSNLRSLWQLFHLNQSISSFNYSVFGEDTQAKNVPYRWMVAM